MPVQAPEVINQEKVDSFGDGESTLENITHEQAEKAPNEMEVQVENGA